MQTVWAVTDGEYSDFRVVGVFSTRERAEDACVRYGNRHARVSQWPVDPGFDELNHGLKTYWVVMQRNGDVTECCEYMGEPLDASGANVWPGEAYDARWYDWMNGLLTHHILARDETHAIKIANEKRAELIAMGKWPEER